MGRKCAAVFHRRATYVQTAVSPDRRARSALEFKFQAFGGFKTRSDAHRHGFMSESWLSQASEVCAPC